MEMTWSAVLMVHRFHQPEGLVDELTAVRESRLVQLGAEIVVVEDE